MRLARLGVLASLLLLPCCEDGSRVSEYTDLMRRAEELDLLDGERVQRLTWELRGDRRALLGQHPPSRLSLPLPEGEDCRLRFAVGIHERAWTKSDGVVFRVSLDAPSRPDALLFELFLDPAAGGDPHWLDQEVAIPPEVEKSEGARVLVLETMPGPEGDPTFDQAGWATPHLVCQRTGSSGGPRADAPPSVVLISVDTLRPDHLGVYGYPRDTSPNLDALGRESLVFEQAFAPAPWTLPSHASMFTGLLPHQHGAGHGGLTTPLRADVATLAEILSAAGYRTLAFTAGGLMSRRNGLDRGFELWVEHARANLDSMLPGVFAALGAEPGPFFLFLHTYDVHGPYAELPGVELVPGSGVRDRPQDPAEWARIASIHYHRYQKLERFEGLSAVVDAYDAGIHWVDARLGRLFDHLRERGLYDGSLIIVTSDHGESLYDRGLYLGHSYTLYDEEVRVPLIARLPHGGQAGSVQELVGLVDLLPMILGIAGMEPPAGLAGSDPLPRLEGDLPPRHPIRGQAAHTGARFVRTLDWKLISEARSGADPASHLPVELRDRFQGGWQLYRLSEDPSEASNQAGEQMDRSEAKDLRRVLEKIPLAVDGSDRAISQEEAGQLRALGYLK